MTVWIILATLGGLTLGVTAMCFVQVAPLGDGDLLSAALSVRAVRPTNWDDDEDPDQLAAWQALDAALGFPPSKP